MTSVSRFSTSDLALASTLAALGFPVEGLEKADSKRYLFLFSDSPELQVEVAKYWRYEIRLEPQVFFSQIKTLKARVYHS